MLCHKFIYIVAFRKTLKISHFIILIILIIHQLINNFKKVYRIYYNIHCKKLKCIGINIILNQLYISSMYCIVLYCIMSSILTARLDRYRIGIPRELSEIRTQPWLSEGSLTCDPYHHRGPIF